ncbi:MAG: hypothetical protein RR879_01805 [Hydrogenoanaerobacterium sp.]
MKQLVYYFLCLKIVIKAAACGYLFVADSSRLPMITFEICAVIIFVGAVVAVRHFANRTTPNEIALFFTADVITTAFNLFFISQTLMIEAGILEMTVTGSLFDVIVGIVIILAAINGKTAYTSFNRERAQAVK